MTDSKPVILHSDEHSVPEHPRLTYTHEQGTKRIVDRASGIDIKIILQWLRDGELPADLSAESVLECVRYQSELDTREALLAWRTCSQPGEMFSGEHLTRFRLLPKADRQLLARIFGDPPLLERESDVPNPVACECDAPVLERPERGICGTLRCTRCLNEWSDPAMQLGRKLWLPRPTYADVLHEVR